MRRLLGGQDTPESLWAIQKFDFVDGRFTHLSSAVMVAWASWSRLASAEGAESTEEDAGCEESGWVEGSDAAAGATSAC